MNMTTAYAAKAIRSNAALPRPKTPARPGLRQFAPRTRIASDIAAVTGRSRARTYGDGVACDITGVSVVYAAGGGGGAGTAGYIPGSAGLGSVRGGGRSDAEIFNAPDNTGSGGGGGSYQTGTYQMGGSGGSGIVVIRVKKFDKIGFSIIVR